MMNIVWFQFDLRIYDHLPLFDASSTGSIIPLYIYDEKIWKKTIDQIGIVNSFLNL